MGTIFGIVILLVDIWAIVQIVKSEGSREMKGVWILIILILPVFGLLIWLFLGPKPARV